MSSESNRELIALLTQLIRDLRINVNASTIKRELRFHPHGNSLLSISGALSRWNVRNAAYNISMAQLPLIPTPFISKFAGDSHQFLIVQKVEAASVHVFEAKKKRRVYTMDEFAGRFSGVVLALEPDEHSGEHQYQQERINSIFSRLRIPLVLLIAAFLAIFCLYHTAYTAFADWRIVLLTLSKALGIYFCAQLVQQVIFRRNAICKDAGAISCGDVLSSRASGILWKQTNWSETGLLYFSGSLLALVSSGGQGPALQWLGILSVACLPYTFFSIYYQAFAVRKWCLLCTMVQGLLWLEAVLLLPYITIPAQLPAAAELGRLLACFAVPLLLLLLLKPLLYKARQAEISTEKLSGFLYNEPLFRLALTNSPQFMPLDEKDLITLGEAEASSNITLVLSPFCDNCATLFQEADHWLSTGPDAQLTILFKPDERPDSPYNNIILDLLAIHQQDERQTLPALRAWYKKRDHSSWATQFPATGDKIKAKEALLAHSAWCGHARVTATPVVYVDGYALPPPYDFAAIPYLVQ